MIHDQHIHTSYSGDSKTPVEEYYKIAHQLGCKYFVVTDHLEFMSVYNNADWTVDYENLYKDLTKLQREYPGMQNLRGVEIGYRKDQLARIEEAIANGDYDLINMSVHDNGVLDYYVIDEFKNWGVDNVLKTYFENIIDALENMKDFDVLSHFDYGFKTAYLIDNHLSIKEYEEYLIKIFTLLIQRSKALEINIKVQETINDLNHTRYFLSLYRSLGGERLTISTDAHTPDKYLLNFEKYANVVKECGFKELCYYVRRKEYRYAL